MHKAINKTSSKGLDIVVVYSYSLYGIWKNITSYL